jgi:hypothetical protein
MAITLTTRDKGFKAAFAALLDAKRETDADVAGAVAAIIDDVRKRGDAALIDYTQRFDRVTLTAKRLRLSADEIAGGQRRWRRCASRPGGSKAFTASKYRKASTTPMPAACGSACAGERWRAPGSTCRVERLPIPPRC